MCVLFSSADGNGDGNVIYQGETIVIPDTVDEEPRRPRADGIVVVDLDEVNSPLPRAEKFVRRKLFDEDSVSKGIESTNGLPNPYYALPPDGSMRRTVSTSNNRHPMWMSKDAHHSPGVYSTASCSPLGPSASPHSPFAASTASCCHDPPRTNQTP